jgi:hypothetical protein
MNGCDGKHPVAKGTPEQDQGRAVVDLGAGGALWGVGGEALQPVPKQGSYNQTIAYWTPEDAVIEGNYPNLLAYVKSLPNGERAPEGLLDEVSEHLSAFNKTLIQTMAQTLQIGYVRINHPKEAVSAMQDSSLQKKTIAKKDARWIFGLISFCLVLLGWFWKKIVLKASSSIA